MTCDDRIFVDLLLYVFFFCDICVLLFTPNKSFFSDLYKFVVVLICPLLFRPLLFFLPLLDHCCLSYLSLCIVCWMAEWVGDCRVWAYLLNSPVRVN